MQCQCDLCPHCGLPKQGWTFTPYWTHPWFSSTAIEVDWSDGTSFQISQTAETEA